nr:reverse transcriptase domain-containing protein [Tanacetum cinerariifolium]
MLVVVYAFEKFRPYLVLSKSIVHTDHLALKYVLSKQDAKPRFIRWVFLLQEFDIIIRDKKRMENLAADHLSRLVDPHKDVFENKDINENFPLEILGKISSGSTPLNDQNLREKATNQMEKFFQIFQVLNFDVSFADALILMLKFALTIKSLLTNKDKLFELAKILLNENCSAMLLKKLPEKLGDPGKVREREESERIGSKVEVGLPPE